MGPQQYAEAIPSQIRERRVEELGLSLRQVADRAGCTYSFLGQVERGLKKRMSPQMAVRILIALEVPQSAWTSYFRFYGLSGAGFRRAA